MKTTIQITIEAPDDTYETEALKRITEQIEQGYLEGSEITPECNYHYEVKRREH